MIIRSLYQRRLPSAEFGSGEVLSDVRLVFSVQIKPLKLFLTGNGHEGLALLIRKYITQDGALTASTKSLCPPQNPHADFQGSFHPQPTPNSTAPYPHHHHHSSTLTSQRLPITPPFLFTAWSLSAHERLVSSLAPRCTALDAQARLMGVGLCLDIQVSIKYGHTHLDIQTYILWRCLWNTCIRWNPMSLMMQSHLRHRQSSAGQDPASIDFHRPSASPPSRTSGQCDKLWK